MCVGSFGLECVKPCPGGYYGKQCSGKCQCDNCNATTGECSDETTTTGCIRNENWCLIIKTLRISSAFVVKKSQLIFKGIVE